MSRDLPPQAIELIDQLAAAWRAGQRLPVEELLQSHSSGQSSSGCIKSNAGLDLDVVIPLIYEEVCLREEQGEVVERSELFQRFPQWQPQLELLLDCYDMLAFPARNVEFPNPGDELGEFLLLSELGRGGAGRVYLAKQTALSGRHVVLKVTPSIGGEHLSLARLQHSGIVPVYSVEEFPDRGLRALCMPYLGGLTLASAMESLQSRETNQRTGRDLAELIASDLKTVPEITPFRGPANQFLARASYSQAVCWIGACLADALHYAHERGLLHLDVKPSNVLLASDGQPMLLDFHLAQEADQIDASRVDWIGGTLGYMSPEQQQLFEAMREGKTINATLNRRTDIYSLGVLLLELLTGALPIEASQRAASLLNTELREGERREGCPRTEWPSDLTTIIARCIEPDPSLRYESAESLAADLRKCLAEPQHAARNSQVAGTAQRKKMVGRLAWGAGWLLSLGLVLFLAEPLKAWLFPRFDSPTAIAKQAEATEQLHRVVEHLTVLDRSLQDGPRQLSTEEVQAVDELCQQVWKQRDELLAGATAHNNLQIRTDLLELASLWSKLLQTNAVRSTKE